MVKKMLKQVEAEETKRAEYPPEEVKEPNKKSDERLEKEK